MLLFYSNGEVRLQNRKLKDRTLQYPEVTAELAGSLRRPDSELILDGEMVVLENGKPSFSRILERDLATDTRRIAAMARSLPALYAAFDLLYLDGEELLARPWHERQELLAGIVAGESPHLHLTENFDDGEKLFSAGKSQGLEGIVAKERDSPYIPGDKTSYWLKIKNIRTLKAAVGGFTLNRGRLGALLLGAYQDGRFLYIGRAGSGLKESELEELKRHLVPRTVEESPFDNLPRCPAGYHWVKPELTVAVDFLEWTPDLRLRAPVVRGFTHDSPADCVL